MGSHLNDNPDRSRPLSISDEELSAFVCGSLDQAARAKVEGYLACNPDLAARIMGELHQRDSFVQPTRRPRSRRAVIAIAAVLGGILPTVLIGGVAVAERWGSPFNAPDYVEDAIAARHATLLRVKMVSQIETPYVDAEEISRIVGLRLPALPENWRIIDVQVFPSDEGPSVSLLLDAADGHHLHLFAVGMNALASERPTVMREQGEYVAYWEVKGTAYTLSGAKSRSDIAAQASLLANPPTTAN